MIDRGFALASYWNVCTGSCRPEESDLYNSRNIVYVWVPNRHTLCHLPSVIELRCCPIRAHVEDSACHTSENDAESQGDVLAPPPPASESESQRGKQIKMKQPHTLLCKTRTQKCLEGFAFKMDGYRCASRYYQRVYRLCTLEVSQARRYVPFQIRRTHATWYLQKVEDGQWYDGIVNDLILGTRKGGLMAHPEFRMRWRTSLGLKCNVMCRSQNNWNKMANPTRI
jgi:hypothetical protein